MEKWGLLTIWVPLARTEVKGKGQPSIVVVYRWTSILLPNVHFKLIHAVIDVLEI